MLYVVVQLSIQEGMVPLPQGSRNIRNEEVLAEPRPFGRIDDLDLHAGIRAHRRATPRAPQTSVPLVSSQRPREVHRSLEDAESFASQCAAENPGAHYGIFTLTDIYETVEQPTPPVLKKMFNAQGELLLKDDQHVG